MTTDIQTNPNIQAVGGDQFVDGTGQTMDLQDLIMAIESKRADLLDKQLADQVGQMKNLNREIAVANKMLNEARNLQNQAGKNGNTEMPPDMIQYFQENGLHQGLSEWDKDHAWESTGHTMDSQGHDYIQSKDEWSVSIENLKAHVDQLNSTSQMAMIRLQSLMNKRNQAYEMMTNALQKLSGSVDKIIANIR